MERFSSWDAAMNERDEDARAGVFDDLDTELNRWAEREPGRPSFDERTSSFEKRPVSQKQSFSERVKQMEEDLAREMRAIKRVTDDSAAFHNQLLSERKSKQNHVYHASAEEVDRFPYNDRMRNAPRTREEFELDGIERQLDQLATKQSLRREAAQNGALNPGHRQLGKFSDSRRQKWSEALKTEDERRLRDTMDIAYDAGTLNGSNSYDLSEKFYKDNGYELRPSRLAPPTNDRHHLMDDGSWHKAGGRPGSGEQGRPAQKPFHQKRFGAAPIKESRALFSEEIDPTLVMERNEQRIKDAIEMRNVERRHELEESFDDWMERHGYGEGTREDGTYDPVAYQYWMRGQQKLLDEYDPDHTPNY